MYDHILTENMRFQTMKFGGILFSVKPRVKPTSECVEIFGVRVIVLGLLLSYSLKLKLVALYMCQCEYGRIDASALIYDVY